MSLPHPEEIWAEVAAMAIASAAIPELHHVGFALDQGGLWVRDIGDGWCNITWIDGDRAVLCGYHNDSSQTQYQVPPIDLLAGGPDWLPWGEPRERRAYPSRGSVGHRSAGGTAGC
ncbi:hypothetical protein [Actinoallomurus iriomotensis]|uniref:Uncharacterized protein n=1 Tax=Actinoallomurus iriomotensis TaxID=478107 RepID=A0A9W6W6Q7_9ACTN|nr:hypothetical protein [Actinoallomurus iriomotensis]GLY91326.1 hypothetical protein Airi02_092550 [Actinoallomurus iriomotensis]